jgi:hypothetical protein
MTALIANRKPIPARPDESRDPGPALILVQALGCSSKTEQALAAVLDPGFRLGSDAKRPTRNSDFSAGCFQ